MTSSLLSLAKNKNGDFFGAPDEMALSLCRSEGTYLNEDSDRSKWKGEWICSHHLDELSRDFYNRVFHHRKFTRSGDLLCGFPEKNHKSKAVNNLELTYSQSKYLLENRNFLLLPGTRGVF